MNQPTAGALLARLLQARDDAATPEELRQGAEELTQQIERQLSDPTVGVVVTVGQVTVDDVPPIN
ncbi:MAG: hypothetical protein NTV02_02020 [Candidatus Zambryskibacteria bacterium]|nr:hypothetical protein [Candidatus Zambryskibacteria bacterium]